MSVEYASSEPFNRSQPSVAVSVFDGIIGVVLYDLYKGELSLFSVAQAIADNKSRGYASKFGEVPETMHVLSLN